MQTLAVRRSVLLAGVEGRRHSRETWKQSSRSYLINTGDRVLCIQRRNQPCTQYALHLCTTNSNGCTKTAVTFWKLNSSFAFSQLSITFLEFSVHICHTSHVLLVHFIMLHFHALTILSQSLSSTTYILSIKIISHGPGKISESLHTLPIAMKKTQNTMFCIRATPFSHVFYIRLFSRILIAIFTFSKVIF